MPLRTENSKKKPPPNTKQPQAVFKTVNMKLLVRYYYSERTQIMHFVFQHFLAGVRASLP